MHFQMTLKTQAKSYQSGLNTSYVYWQSAVVRTWIGGRPSQQGAVFPRLAMEPIPGTMHGQSRSADCVTQEHDLSMQQMAGVGQSAPWNSP